MISESSGTGTGRTGKHMNEDDTFNALRRVSFEEMRRLVIRKNETNIPEEDYNRVMKELIEGHGWTIDEYDISLTKRKWES